VPEAEEAALVAIADLHVEVPANRRFVEALRPTHDEDWLIVCGDVGEMMADVERTLATLAGTFAQVVWVPGNHELWTTPADPVQLRGVARYERLVAHCRDHGIATPEDPFPVWRGAGGPVVVAPLFTLYDYSFGLRIAQTTALAMAAAHAAGIVCSDEYVLHPDPHPSRARWCRERIEITEARLVAMAEAGMPSVMVSHFPLIAELTHPLYYPEFAQWCGTTATADWHLRFGAQAVIYGHLHLPRSSMQDGVRFEEVSLGYPRQRQARADPPAVPRRIVLGGARSVPTGARRC